ncbi:histidine kinase [Clostridium carboxidivorans P7]|uniref:Stage 0 sporulation protein A homolog n=1 Tax=Clostridium carboxidivorans P7 TaxID=536227 RepID=C6PYR6_9CLOT|nr:LytTR family DNA-binding domain-containing protein [Clostridium carboxidivorans]AKN29995.1 histidine kinase [Clostridium carboxidivorans P7]EET85597.1 two component transcriptional regulator, LytTR family [Clostridium carboxidivorans P7]
MIKIYICEDIEEHRNRIRGIVKDIILEEELDMTIEIASPNPMEVLNKAKENDKDVSLYFLDVGLNSDINGITLASKIREFDEKGFIVFVTTHGEMSYLTFTYKVEAMDYIIKDDYSNMAEKIKQCILETKKRYLKSDEDDGEIFTIRKEDKVINIKYKDILFFETSDTIHKIILHAINRQVEFYGKMKDIEETLDERFVRFHRAYLVNKDNISEIDKKNRIIHMVNGEICYSSAKNLENFCTK